MDVSIHAVSPLSSFGGGAAGAASCAKLGSVDIKKSAAEALPDAASFFKFSSFII
jgi:hypothetical protein